MAAIKNKPPATCIVIKGIGDWDDGTKGGSKNERNMQPALLLIM